MRQDMKTSLRHCQMLLFLFLKRLSRPEKIDSELPWRYGCHPSFIILTGNMQTSSGSRGHTNYSLYWAWNLPQNQSYKKQFMGKVPEGSLTGSLKTFRRTSHLRHMGGELASVSSTWNCESTQEKETYNITTQKLRVEMSKPKRKWHHIKSGHWW